MHMLIGDVEPGQDAEAKSCFDNNLGVYMDVYMSELLKQRQPTTRSYNKDLLLQHHEYTVE